MKKIDLSIIEKNLLLYKFYKNNNLFLNSEKNNVSYKRQKNILKDNKKYIGKIFFKELKEDFENTYKIGPDFKEIFKNPYLLNYIDEDEEFYIFEKAKGFVYDKIKPSIEQNFIIYLNHEVCKYFQKQFDTKLFLFCETHKIDDLVFNENGAIFHDIKKLVILDDNILDDLWLK